MGGEMLSTGDSTRKTSRNLRRLSLQTYTMPDYKQRLIIQGELVEKST
jgi:hypothetical protein